MADKSAGILVDKDLRPAYYDDFHCLAAGCKLSCCKGSWSITFDKKDYLSLKRQKGSDELNAKLENSVRRIRKGPIAENFYGEFSMDSGACPLLSKDGLCSLQMEKGHTALPYVCRIYPRTQAYMLSGYLERSLSPSCEGVLQLLWNLPEGIEFRSDPLPKTEWKRVTTTGQEPLASWFPVVREWCIDCLQDRRFPLPQRILMMGLGLQELANGEMDLCRWRERVSLLPESSGGALLPNGAKERAIVLMGCVRTLLTIQHDDVAFQRAREEIFHALDVRIQREEKKATASVSRYQQALGKYEELFQGHGYFMENLMVSVFFLLRMPSVGSREDLWKSYVNFCNLYAFFRFMAAMGCREGIEDCKAEMFRLLALTSRALLHNNTRRSALRDEFFKNDSATLAHMAILLGG